MEWCFTTQVERSETIPRLYQGNVIIWIVKCGIVPTQKKKIIKWLVGTVKKNDAALQPFLLKVFSNLLLVSTHLNTIISIVLDINRLQFTKILVHFLVSVKWLEDTSIAIYLIIKRLIVILHRHDTLRKMTIVVCNF